MAELPTRQQLIQVGSTPLAVESVGNRNKPAQAVARDSAPTTRVARLPLRTIIFYGLPALAFGCGGSLVGFYFLKFATDVLFIAPATMGFIIACARIWDAISDPLVGYWSDRTRTRIGRRLPWLYASALPAGVLFAALWAPPPALVGIGLIAWLAVALVLFQTAVTAFVVPHAALGAELSLDHHERTRVFTASKSFAGLGGLLGLTTLALIVGEQPAGQRSGMLWVALLAGLLLPTLAFAANSQLRERPEHWGRGPESPSAAARDVWANPHARRLLAITFLTAAATTCIVTTAPYACQYLFGDLALLPKLLLAFSLSNVAAMPIWPPLSRRFGKRRIWLVACSISALAVAALFSLSTHDGVTAVLALVAITGASAGASSTIGTSIRADVIDYDEDQTGERKEGAYFAIFGVAAKLAFGLAVLMVAVALDVSGFAPNVAQRPATTLVMRVLLGPVPCAMLGGAIALMFSFRLNEHEHAAIRARLEGRLEERAP